MGFFDFLKNKEKQPAAASTTTPQNEPYLGDLNKTQAIIDLINVPQKERGQNWIDAFLENLPAASFRCAQPQVVTGPDGFPYFQLLLPEPNKSFQCFVIDKMTDDFLLEKGFGVVVNPSGTKADWVLSYGDILNLHLNNTFYTSDSLFSKQKTDEIIAEEEKVMIGQPSKTLLPKQTRKLLSDYLKMNGVTTPKVLLLMRHHNGKQEYSQDLAFNVTPGNFENEEKYRAVMASLGWFLPRHYSFVALSEDTFKDGFMPL